jgi:drug/metabolite transporter (DMT)-like permease
LLAFAISLASAFSWGVSDFLGGLQSRRIPVVAVLAVSQPAGLLLALILIPLLGADPLPAEDLAIAFAAGAASLGGLAAFYSAMAMGTISVVAPIASLGVVVPVAVGLAQGEEPGAVQLVGLVVATVGVVVLSYEEDPEHQAVARRSIVLAILAGLGFGIFFTGLDAASTSDQPGWAVVSARVGAVAAVAAALVLTRPSFNRVSGALLVLLAIGTFDILANALFAIASTKGLLPVVAVGGSMYPAFTIALAHLVLGERLALAQRAGVALALAGVALIAGGS